MPPATKTDRRRIGIGLAASALLMACGASPRHNSAENEFTAWANHVERTSAKNQSIPDFEEPANVMDRAPPTANGQ